MGSRNLLLNNVVNFIAQDLYELGFEKRKWGTFTYALNQESIGWIGLNHAIYQGIVSINPVIGIGHQPLERLVAEISSVCKSFSQTPTISSEEYAISIFLPPFFCQ
jgi:hypothetical protein